MKKVQLLQAIAKRCVEANFAEVADDFTAEIIEHYLVHPGDWQDVLKELKKDTLKFVKKNLAEPH